MTHLHLAHPALLCALLLIPGAILWRLRRGRAPLLVVPHAAAWAGGGGERSRPFIAGLYGALLLGTLALARPQLVEDLQTVRQQGYDLVLAVDLSTSMLSEDYEGPHGRINRLETIRPVIQTFIRQRPHDRIGIVVFARRAMTLAPLTTDHDWVARQVARLHTGLLKDGTAIGDGLGIALNDIETGRRGEAQADRQEGRQDDPPNDLQRSAGAFVVLLTDGSSNSGELTPAEATALARHRGIPVYAVGTGRNGIVPFPVFDARGRRIGTTGQPSALDIDALKTMARETGGRFFMAGDTAALQDAFRTIDQARKAHVSVRHTVRVRELFAWLAGAALLLLLLAAPGVHRARPSPLPPVPPT